MTDEQLRVFLLLNSFFERTSLRALDCHEKKITPEQFADVVKAMSAEYEKKLHRT